MSASTEEVTQLLLRERQSRDRGWWEQMADCFAPDSTVNMSWFNGTGAEFVKESRRMSSGGWGGQSVHRLSPPAVRAAGDRALAELPLVIEFRITIDGVERISPPTSARSTGRCEPTAPGASRGSRRSTNETPSDRQCREPILTSTRRNSPPTGPLTATSPGTRAGSASSSDPTCSETTSRNPSHARTRPKPPGSRRPSGSN